MGPLRDLGIELLVSPFLDDATYRVLYREGGTAPKAFGVLKGIARRLRDLVRATSADLVLVHRESAPIGPPLIEMALSALRIPYVFDFDDALFLNPIHPANRRWAWMRHPSRVAVAVREARAVIAGNVYLGEWAGALNSDVTVLPTPVDVMRHGPKVHAQGNPVVIGWIGSSTTAPYLHLLDAPLSDLAKRCAIELRVIGGTYAHPSVAVRTTPFSLKQEPADLAACDIGVLPEPDDAWTRGKGAFKAILYMAAGLPVVASDVGANPSVVLHGQTGFIATDAGSWVTALERLATDVALRARMGTAGRRRAEDRYSVEVLAPVFAQVLRRAAAGRAIL